MRRLLLALVLGATVALVAAPAGARPGAPRAGSGSFSGTAVADAVRANVRVPDYLLIEDFVDGGGPSAQAVLDSLGKSQAFASFPYPGELGVSATGLVSILTGFSLPSYPFIASSSHPITPARDIDQPGFHLNAHSEETSSEGLARFGEATEQRAVESGGVAIANVATDGEGAVVAHAETRFGLTIGPVSLQGVEAVAEARRSAEGVIELSSSLAVTSLGIGGVEVEIGDRGLMVAGSPLVPLDLLSGLTDLLQVGDTTVELLPEVRTADSVTSAGLLITTEVPIDAIDRPVQVSYRLGNVMATANASAFGTDVRPNPPLPDGSPLVAAPTAPDLGFSDGAIGAPVASPVTPQPEGSGAPAVVTSRQIGELVRISSWTFFPILVLAGAVLLSGALGGRFEQHRAKRRGDPSWSS